MTGQPHGLVVLFATHPGLGKTELCDRLPDYLPSYNVQQLNTNHESASARKGGQYWQRAAKLASSGCNTVVLASKCLVNNPKGESSQSLAISKPV
jgi:hypothetical protein